VRWLLLKDLQILRRSPLLVGLLIVYPIVISLLVGLAIDRPPQKPKVAFANLVPEGESAFSLGGRKLDVADYAPQLFKAIDPIRVGSREEAIAKVRSGEALGAMVIPENAAERLVAHVRIRDGLGPSQGGLRVVPGELLKDVFPPETRTRFLAIADEMKARDGVEAVILGGTEIPLLLRTEEHNGIQLLDTTRIHVDRLIEEMLT